MSDTKTLTKPDLRQFTGSEHWYRHALNRKVLFTDGAKYVADQGGAYWLLDDIALIQPYDKAIAAEEFQVWRLKVSTDHTATLTCENGNGTTVFTKALDVHRFSAAGNHALFSEQHHLPAERVLRQDGAAGRGSPFFHPPSTNRSLSHEDQDDSPYRPCPVTGQCAENRHHAPALQNSPPASRRTACCRTFRCAKPPAANLKWSPEADASPRSNCWRSARRWRRMRRSAATCCPTEDAAEISLAENEMRQAMHPADQFEAFKALIDSGHGIEDIAARFGVTPTVVRQRLKLAAVSPKLMAIYREAAMTLDQLMAFTVSDDHAAQEAAWFEAPDWQRSAHAIRQTLTAAHVKANDRRARFVTVAAYAEAGGAVIADLFRTESDGYLTDPALLDRLANEKLEREADAMRQEGWKWVEIMPDPAALDLDGFGEAKGKAQPLPAKQAKAFAKAEREADRLPRPRRA